MSTETPLSRPTPATGTAGPPTAGPPTAEETASAWDRAAAGYDQVVTPMNLRFAEEALDRVPVGRGVRVLDVACGPGALALTAARRGADVVAVDIAPEMVQRLADRARALGLTRVTGGVGDAQALDLPDDSVDVAVSQHGVSLVPDVALGLREMTRVTRPGGRVLVVAFGRLAEMELLGFFGRAVGSVVPGFPGLPADPPPPPFRLADPDVLAAGLTDAGLGAVRVERLTGHAPYRSGTDVWEAVVASNPVGAAMAAALPPGARDRVVGVLDGMLAERVAAGDAISWPTPGRPSALLHMALNVAVGTAGAGEPPGRGPRWPRPGGCQAPGSRPCAEPQSPDGRGGRRGQRERGHTGRAYGRGSP